MATQWYYTTNKQQMGPVGWDELRQLASAGLLRPDDLVWTDSMGEWVQARQQEGLFAGDTAITLPRSEVEEMPAPRRSSATRQRIDRELDDESEDERRGRRKSRRRDGNTGLKIALIVGGIALVVLVLACGVGGVLLIVFGGVFRGGGAAGGTYSLDLVPATQNERHFEFRAGQRVQITVTTSRVLGPFQPDVDLFILRRGAVIAADTRIHPDCNVTFVTPANDTYTVRVQNLGPGRARSRVVVQ